MKVLITTSTFGEVSDEPLQVLNDAGIRVRNNPYKRKVTQTELLPLLDGIQGVIAGLETYDNTVLSNSKLKIISRCGSGLSNIDMDAAKKLGVDVYYTPQGPTQSVAELTVGCLLSLIRNISFMNDQMHNGKWSKYNGRLLQNMKVFVIGYGRIGKTVAKILDAIGANIFVYDPFIIADNLPENFTKVNLNDGLKLSDVITIHSSGENLILGEKEFNLMKSGVYILNAARGSLIDEGLLEQGLITGNVAGAWLDTFQEEPYKGTLTKYSQVILTPHIGSYTIEGRKKMELDCVKNLIKGIGL